MSPALPEDLVEEVLLRFPPEDPALLVRTALVCKNWFRLISDPGFRRRFQHRHRIPSLLGYFYHRDALPYFEPTSSFRPPYAARRGWDILNARHGRVLVLSFVGRDEELIVWDPATDEQRRLPMPPVNHRSWNAALLCAAAGCDHFDCPWGPFLVVFVCRHGREQGMNMSACVYSSEQGAWRERISILHHGLCGMRLRGPNVLVENAIYFGCDIKTGILEYDLDKQELTMIGLPPLLPWQHFVLMTAEDGGLGLAHCKEYKLCLWKRVAAGRTGTGYATWTLHRVIELDKAVFHIRDLSTSPYAYTVVIADDVGAVFIWVDKVLFTIHLRSSRIKKVGYVDFAFGVVPYMNFYTPALREAFTGEEARAVASSASWSREIQ